MGTYAGCHWLYFTLVCASANWSILILGDNIWSFLSWFPLSSPVLRWMFWVDVNRKYFWGSASFGHLSFWVHRVFKNWELILKNRKKLHSSTGERKEGALSCSVCSLEMGGRDCQNRLKEMVCCRAGVETGGRFLRKEERINIRSSILCWTTFFSWIVNSQETSSRDGCWYKKMSRKERHLEEKSCLIQCWKQRGSRRKFC